MDKELKEEIVIEEEKMSYAEIKKFKDTKRALIYHYIKDYNDLTKIKEFVDLLDELDKHIIMEQKYSICDILYRIYLLKPEVAKYLITTYKSNHRKLYLLPLISIHAVLKHNHDLYDYYKDDLDKFIIVIIKFLKDSDSAFDVTLEQRILDLAASSPEIRYFIENQCGSSNSERLSEEVIDLIQDAKIGKDKILFYINYCLINSDDNCYQDFREYLKENS